MLIDCHVHLYPPEANRDPAGWAAVRGEAHWATLSTRRRKDGAGVQSFPDVEELLRQMDAASVTKAVLLGWYWENPETCAEQNRFHARCVRGHPQRLSAFATVHPRAGVKATQLEMHRARDEGLIGLGELSPHSQGYSIDDPGFNAALELAADFAWPVNLHVTDPESREFPGRVPTPLMDFVLLAERHRKTNFILAHWGGLLPLREERARTCANLFYDTAASPLLYDESIWRRFLRGVPRGRVLFGSDFPLNVYPRLDAAASMPRMVAELHRSGLSADDLVAVTSTNARRLLPML